MVPLYVRVAKAAQDNRNGPNGRGLRIGQSLMNALHDIDSDAYKTVHGTLADCFYDDKRIAKFILALMEYEQTASEWA